jgi:iron(III) transport system permease protein
MILPLAYLTVRTLGADNETWQLLFRWRTLAIILRSFILVVAVTTASIAISLPLAWITTRTDLPLKRMWFIIANLPLVIPSFVGGLVVVAAFGPKGIFQQLVSPLGIDRLPEIYGFPGAFLTLTLLSYPYIFLTLRAAIRRLDPSLEDASRSLGKGRWETFFKVIIPQLRPAIAGGGLLVALYTLSDFGAVSLLRFETFTWAIYLQYQTVFDRSVAAALSLVLVIFAMGILLIELMASGRAKYYSSEAKATRVPSIVTLGAWKWPAIGFCITLVSFGLLIPVAVLAYWFIRGISIGENMGISWSIIFNSLSVSLLAALITTIAAIPIVIMIVRFPGGFSRIIERFCYMGFALPGIVVALALVFFGTSIVLPLYQTLGMLLFAYTILFMPASLGAIKASFLQVNPRIEEAAQGLGNGPLKVFTSITFPLIRSGVLAGAALVFLVTMKELPATLILGPLGFKTLATSVWSATSEGFFSAASVPALILIFASFIPMSVLMIGGRRSWGI